MARPRFSGSRCFTFWRSAGVRLLMLGAVAGYTGFVAAPPAGAVASAQGGINSTALQQIAALQEEKAARTPIQRKIDSNLLYAAKQGRGEPIADGVDALETGVESDANGMVEVNITADISPALLRNLKSRGVVILDVVERFRSISARVPLQQLETIAGYREVQFVQPPQEAMRAGAVARPKAAATQRKQIGSPLRGVGPQIAQQPVTPAAGAVDSEGDTTHRAAQARAQLGVDGSGVNVCVLSDGVDTLAQQQAAGELPAVTVLPGQAGSGNEGTAMLEIVHDLAPGAELFFATGQVDIDPDPNQVAYNPAGMAQNILDLRSNYGCDIIVDDISFFSETPFQNGQAPNVLSTTNSGAIIQAVNEVTAQGTLYFSSAGNFGNFSSGESGTWEGDFVDGGPAAIPGAPTVTGTVHDFDPGPSVTAYNTLSTGLNGQNPGILFWSDPLGGSANDYDLYVFSAGNTVVDASTDFQTGSQDPIEGVGPAAMAPGNRLVVVQNIGAQDRFLHLAANGSTLAFSTPSAVYGHNGSEATFSVAATPAERAAFPPYSPSGPFPEPFSAGNRVEPFSSDGPRLVFYNADGTPITPGNLLAGGGQQLQKPDATAADGVSTDVQGFDPFFGTSAAAPHAAAIAALLKSADASLTNEQIRDLLTETAIDIQDAGQDRDSGAGIIDAYNALSQVIPAPSPEPTPTPPTPTPPAPTSDNSIFVPLAGR